MRTTTTRTALALACAMVALAGCGDDATDSTPEPTDGATQPADDEPTDDGSTDDGTEDGPSDDDTSDEDPSDEDPVAGDDGEAYLSASCTLSEASVPVTVPYPSDWVASDDCTAFDPERIPESSDFFAISVRAVDEPFADMVDGAAEARERQLAVVDGLQAVRTIETSELGNGTRVVWRVDLDPGLDDESASTLIASAENTGVVTPGILDQMLANVDVDVDLDAPGTIVARSEGGGTPYTVVLTDDDCLQLYPATLAQEPNDEVCLDEGDLGDTEAVVTRLRFGDGIDVVAGIAGDGVTAVSAEGVGPQVRTVTSDTRRGFGFLAGSDVDEVTLLVGDGSRVGTEPVRAS